MAIPIINDWEKYYTNPHEGLGSSYERIIINRHLLRIAKQYGVQTALESPSFGFTGISGINLLALADAGVSVTLEDNSEQRLELISDLWSRLGRPLKPVHNPAFQSLSYPEGSFDMSFSFSALWFVPVLKDFLAELSRVTSRIIFISVPNRDGLGYKLQLKDYNPEKYPALNLGNIDPPSITGILGKLGWTLKEADYFDCPPWPDIGMTKEDLLQKWFPWCPLQKKASEPGKAGQKVVSILDWYSGKDPQFQDRLLGYQWLEKLAPRWFKRIWAHHYYLVFTRTAG